MTDQGRKTKFAPGVWNDSWLIKFSFWQVVAAAEPPSIPGAIHERALFDPRHHGAQFFANFLDRVGGVLRPHRLERGLVDAVFQHPLLDEFARLDVAENSLHLGAGFGGDYARAGHVLAVFGGV